MVIKQLVLSAIQKLITREQKINYTLGVYTSIVAKEKQTVEPEEAIVFDAKAPAYANTSEYNEGIGYTNLN